jgi:hypothetical protein
MLEIVVKNGMMLHVRYPSPIVASSASGGGRHPQQGTMTNDDSLNPVVVQQSILHLASASLNNVGDYKSTGQPLVYALCVDNVGNNQTTATTTSSYCPIVL